MTQHLHPEYEECCFRCELSRDDAVVDDAIDAINVQVDLLVARGLSSLRYARLRHGYALVRED